MQSEEKTTTTIALLKKHYWGNILILAVLLLLVIFNAFPFFRDTKQVSVILERYDIVILIIAIPLSLKYFSDKIKKTSHPIEMDIAIEIYKKASYLRLYTFSFLTFAQVVLFGYSRNMNFFWLAIVLFTVFLFCKPSYVELAEMSEKPEEQTPKEEYSNEENMGEENMGEENGNEENGNENSRNAENH